jgi:hypothetical protein
LARFSGNGITATAAGAVAKEHAGPGQVDALERFAAAALVRVGGVLLASAAFAASAEQGFIAFDLDHVPPRHRLAATVISRSFADRVAITASAAGAGVKNVAPHILDIGLGRCSGLRCSDAAGSTSRGVAGAYRTTAISDRQSSTAASRTIRFLFIMDNLPDRCDVNLLDVCQGTISRSFMQDLQYNRKFAPRQPLQLAHII